jgi:hypothetical protein
LAIAPLPAEATEVTAPFVEKTYINPKSTDPMFSIVRPTNLGVIQANRGRLHLPDVRISLLQTGFATSYGRVVVVLGNALGACQRDFGEVRDLIPRIEHCPMRLGVERSGQWTARDIGTACAIYNEDPVVTTTRAFATYDASEQRLHLYATLDGKRQPECDRTVQINQQ